jgi:hypothetical protein
VGIVNPSDIMYPAFAPQFTLYSLGPSPAKVRFLCTLGVTSYFVITVPCCSPIPFTWADGPFVLFRCVFWQADLAWG